MCIKPPNIFGCCSTCCLTVAVEAANTVRRRQGSLEDVTFACVRGCVWQDELERNLRTWFHKTHVGGHTVAKTCKGTLIQIQGRRFGRGSPRIETA